ncbi:sulfotransferase domain-containing protein [Palleronia sp.]|uniref:sulfotransferase domain-containing protein n=1 Tax=Palleronia sp. TaxID=1940284 RepID=UPI0035C8139B
MALSDKFKSFASQRSRNVLRPYAYFLFRGWFLARSRLGYAGTAPSFIIIGTQKGGTTTLYEALCAHSRIVSARTKEISFFDRYFDLGKKWYLANFPDLSGTDKITGEATPDYMFGSQVPERVEQVLGRDVKFIVLLRDPLSRSVSQYFHEYRLGTETAPIEEAFALEESRLEGNPDQRTGPRLENLTNRFSFGYRERSRYAKQLQPWFDRFGRRSFYIETSENFFDNPNKVRDEVIEFLGLKPEPLPEIKARNVGTYGAKVPPELYSRLEKELEDERRQMNELIKETRYQ